MPFLLQRMHAGFDWVLGSAWAMHSHSVDHIPQDKLLSFSGC